jgi:hypothetical protein
VVCNLSTQYETIIAPIEQIIHTLTRERCQTIKILRFFRKLNDKED